MRARREVRLTQMRWSHGEVKGTLEGSPVAGRGAVQQVMAQVDRREVLIKQG